MPSCAGGVLRRKPLSAVAPDAEDLPRTLGLWDLVAIGVGGTVGSGIFAEVGSVAANNAGPGVVLCLAVGTVGCLLTCGCYVRLSQHIPSTGSVYAYTYHALGEGFAVVAAWCLTLEYAISGAAVARSWGGKLAYAGVPVRYEAWGLEVDVAAVLLLVCCTLLLSKGMDLGKLFVNGMTLVKLAVVAFLIIGSLCLFDAANLSPLIPPAQDGKYGLAGLAQGSVAAFFCFIGFDEVCCLSGEAKRPEKDIPLACYYSAVGTGVLTMLAALGLAAAAPYGAIDPDAAFESLFMHNGYPWAAQVVQWGELITLPVVVLIAMLPQSRLFYAMAQDGLLPRWFATQRHGVLLYSNVLVGLVCLVLGAVLDFDVFADTISAGVLLSFSLANASLVALTVRPAGAEAPPGAMRLLALFALLSALASCLLGGLVFPGAVLGGCSAWPLVSGLVAAVLAAVACGVAVKLCRLPQHAGSPLVALVALAYNALMLGTLSLEGLAIIGAYLLLGLLVYAAYGKQNRGHAGEAFLA